MAFHTGAYVPESVGRPLDYARILRTCQACGHYELRVEAVTTSNRALEITVCPRCRIAADVATVGHYRSRQ